MSDQFSPALGRPPEQAEFDLAEINPIRRAIGDRTQFSVVHAPHFYVGIEVAMTRVVADRTQRKEAAGDQAPTLNDYVLLATAHALRQHPDLNVAFSEEGLRRFRQVNLGFVVSVEDMILVPVIKDADAKSLEEISAAARELAGKARNKRLRARDQEGGTFTVSNMGGFGVDWFTAIISPPQAGILAVGGMQSKPVVRESQVVVRAMMPLVLSIDHRAADGIMGAAFLGTLRKMIENWPESG